MDLGHLLRLVDEQVALNATTGAINTATTNRLRCKKTLRKSTYGGAAFLKGRSYEVSRRTPLGIFVRDEEGHDFGPFVEAGSDARFYVLTDYFSEVT